MISSSVLKTGSNKTKIILLVILSGMMFLWGGIYDFCVAIYGVIFCFGIFWIIKRGRKIEIPKNVTTIGLGIMLLGFCISSLAAKDKGMAFIGIINMLVFVLFWILWSNFPHQIRENIWEVIPDATAGITAISMILYFVPAAKEYLYRAGRLGGVFQYSNTYAILLLIALVLIFFREQRTLKDYIEILILVSGILLCGSRSVMIFAIAVLIVLIANKRVDKKSLLMILGIIIIIVILSQGFLELDLQRLLQLSLNSSTLNGRFLYWKDAIVVLCQQPLGLGYMGYFFLQPQFQTGNYVTKYVHNDILQFGLDAGIIAMIALCVILIVNVFSGRIRGRNRVVLVILVL